MAKDLWGFKGVSDLEKDTQEMPDSILNEQIELLGKKTDFNIYGKSINVKINTHTEIDYKIATLFQVVVPALDNYMKTIFIMYSNPETDYPVAITVGTDYDEDQELFMPKYTCKNKDEFEQSLSQILSSDEVMHIIKILYSKSKTIFAQN